MKTNLRLLTVLCAFAFVTATVSAQTRVTPRVGVNVSGLETSLQDFDADVRAGWNAGFDLRVGSGIFFLNPGLHYYSFTARLFDEVNQDTQVDFSEETTIQSLRAPLNIGLRLTGDNGLLGIYAKGGVTPAYVLGVKETDNFNFSADELNRFTWGANVGVGVDILFLTAELNYEKGLTDFFDGVEGRNNMLTLSVGLKF
ncbi:MAG: porin family protein [Lewinella sp.]|nr:porin family protein [Lewinella sp.]